MAKFIKLSVGESEMKFKLVVSSSPDDKGARYWSIVIKEEFLSGRRLRKVDTILMDGKFWELNELLVWTVHPKVSLFKDELEKLVRKTLFKYSK